MKKVTMTPAMALAAFSLVFAGCGANQQTSSVMSEEAKPLSSLVNSHRPTGYADDVDIKVTIATVKRGDSSAWLGLSGPTYALYGAVTYVNPYSVVLGAVGVGWPSSLTIGETKPVSFGRNDSPETRISPGASFSIQITGQELNDMARVINSMPEGPSNSSVWFVEKGPIGNTYHSWLDLSYIAEVLLRGGPNAIETRPGHAEWQTTLRSRTQRWESLRLDYNIDQVKSTGAEAVVIVEVDKQS